MSNIFFMPLRKGSQSIKGKNFKPFLGKPLFGWYIETIIRSAVADEIWIATDCPHVRKLVLERYPQVFIFDRSPFNAQDESPTIDVVLEFLRKRNYAKDDVFVLVQATSPLTSSDDLLSLNRCIQQNLHDSYIACARLKRFRWSDDGSPLDYDLKNKPRRQDYHGFLVESGAFYASKVGLILETDQLVSGKIKLVELGNEALIDIDEPVDWEVGEAYLRHLINKEHEKGILLGLYESIGSIG